MFPLKPKDHDDDAALVSIPLVPGSSSVAKKGPEAKWGLLAGLLLILLFTVPYIINVEMNAGMEESPASNLNEFLVKAAQVQRNIDLATEQQIQVVRLPEEDMTNQPPAEAMVTTTQEVVDTNIGYTNIEMSPQPEQTTAVSETPQEVQTAPTEASVIPPEAEGDKKPKKEKKGKKEKALRGVDNDQQDQQKQQEQMSLSITIYGSKIDQRLGKQNPGKACLVFYSDDPAEIDNGASVLSTKICPDKRDRHIEFHMRGIFSTHPHAPGGGDEAQVRVQFIHAGPAVWATFFAQHDDKHETIVVPPGVAVHITELTANHKEEFYQDFDSVRVLYTSQYAARTRGHQHIFPSCVQFYETRRVDKKTKGLKGVWR
jgi:hypothetical protein